MKSSLEENIDSNSYQTHKILSCNSKSNQIVGSVSSEAEPSISKQQKPATLLSWPPVLSIFASSDTNCDETKNCGIDSGVRKKTGGKNYYDSWRAAVRRVMMNGVSMRRILGFSRASVTASRSDIWILGVCYKVVTDGDDASTSDPSQSEGFVSFVEDFSSRILITYRKGFGPIGDTKYSSDVSWGCMLRSSQMLVAQAFVVHKLGRSWRKSLIKPLDQAYVEILHLFGDSDESPCSIHNLLQAGKAYGLAAGSWIGPYATCRAWENLVGNKREESKNGMLSTMMAMYVVSGDGDGERGGAPVLCIEDLCKHCSEFSEGQSQWSPVLLMVPLVLGLEKVNPRYLPLLSATFTFPQSLGIMGGRPGASTYIVGVQDEKAFYLDPHEVQQAVDIKSNDLEVDTSSYHCNIVRHMPLDSIDSSLAIGFYCRDKADFDDFCVRASDLINQSNGAPLFTIAETKPAASQHSTFKDNPSETCDYDPIDALAAGGSENNGQEDDWQLL